MENASKVSQLGRCLPESRARLEKRMPGHHRLESHPLLLRLLDGGDLLSHHGQHLHINPIKFVKASPGAGAAKSNQVKSAFLSNVRNVQHAARMTFLSPQRLSTARWVGKSSGPSSKWGFLPSVWARRPSNCSMKGCRGSIFVQSTPTGRKSVDSCPDSDHISTRPIRRGFHRIGSWRTTLKLQCQMSFIQNYCLTFLKPVPRAVRPEAGRHTANGELAAVSEGPLHGADVLPPCRDASLPHPRGMKRATALAWRGADGDVALPFADLPVCARSNNDQEFE